MSFTRTILLAPIFVLGCGSSDPATTPAPGDVVAPPNPEAPAVEGEPGEGIIQEGDTPPAFGRIDPPGFVLGDGEGVLISGTVVQKAEIEPVGTLRLEVSVLTGPEDTPMNQMVHVQDLEGLGEFQIRVPADLGKVNLTAYFDEEMNGPNPGELGGGTQEPFTVGSTDVTGVVLSLDAVLGDPPEGQEIGPDGKPVIGPGAPIDAAPVPEPAVDDAPAAPEAPAEAVE